MVKGESRKLNRQHTDVIEYFILSLRTKRSNILNK